MRLFRWVKKEILYNKRAAVLTAGASILMAVIFWLVIKCIDYSGQKLEEIYKTTEVRMIIHRANGVDNLRLDPRATAELEQSGYFTKSVYSSAFDYYNIQPNPVQFYSDSGDWELWAVPLPYESLPTVQCFIGDQSKNLSYGECIAGTGSPVAQGNSQLKIHPENITFSSNQSSKAGDAWVKLTAVGTVDGNNIYINYDQYKDICNSLNIPVTIYSAEFIIRDSKNLDQVYDYLSKVRIFRDITVRATGGYTYQILDGVLRERTEPLIFQIKVLHGVIPVLFGLSVCVGAGLSCLSLRLGKRTLFLMKSMGTPAIFRFLTAGLKQAIFCLTGFLPGFLFLPAEYILIYFCCYLTGSIVTILGFTLKKSFAAAAVN